MDVYAARMKGYNNSPKSLSDSPLRKPSKNDVALIGISLANPAFTGEKLRAMVKMVQELFSEKSILLLCDTNHRHNIWAETESANDNDNMESDNVSLDIRDADRYREEALKMGDLWLKENWGYIEDLQPNLVRWDDICREKTEFAKWEKVVLELLQSDKCFTEALENDVQKFTAKLASAPGTSENTLRRFYSASTAYIVEECIVLGMLCSTIDMVLYPGRLPDSVSHAGLKFNQLMKIGDKQNYKLQHRELAFRKVSRGRGAA